MGNVERWHQCPGCWSAIRATVPDDGWIECDCGERMTVIDLRAAPQPQGAVEERDRLRREVADVLVRDLDEDHPAYARLYATLNEPGQ